MRCLKVPHFIAPREQISSSQLTSTPEAFLEIWHEFTQGPYELARKRWSRATIEKMLLPQEIAQICYDNQDYPTEITSPLMGTLEVFGHSQFYRPDTQREVSMSVVIENCCQLQIAARTASALFKSISPNFVDKIKSSEVILFINVTQSEFLRREMAYCHSYRRRARHTAISPIPAWVNWVTTRSELVKHPWTTLKIRALHLPTQTTQFSINVSALHMGLNECAILPYLVYQAWKMVNVREDQVIEMELPILHSEVVRLERAAFKRAGGRK